MDLGSEIRDPEKTYSGSRGQKGTGSRIRIRNTARKVRKINYFLLDNGPVRDSSPRLRLRVHEPSNGRGKGAQGTPEVQAAGQAGQFFLFGQI
jgi:hypothetical protein